MPGMTPKHGYQWTSLTIGQGSCDPARSKAGKAPRHNGSLGEGLAQDESAAFAAVTAEVAPGRDAALDTHAERQPPPEGAGCQPGSDGSGTARPLRGVLDSTRPTLVATSTSFRKMPAPLLQRSS